MNSESGTAHPPQLERLNRAHGFPLAARTAHSLLGRLRRRLASLLLGDYARDHAAFQLDLVQYLNTLHDRVARLDIRMSEEIRWSVESLERKLQERFRAEVADLRSGIEELRHAVARDYSELKTLDSVARGIERILGASAGVPAHQPATACAADYSYLLLENRFRGGEDEIRERLRAYLPIFQTGTIGGVSCVATTGPILEIGAGRGELQLLLKEAGVASYGVDFDAAMVARCQSLGLDVRQENGIEHLRALADRSLGGVIAVQVVEHLPIAVLRELLALCNRKVEQGGRIVFETINTASMVALAHNYFRDPTHEWPLHPETMRYLVELAGAAPLTLSSGGAAAGDRRRRVYDSAVGRDA